MKTLRVFIVIGLFLIPTFSAFAVSPSSEGLPDLTISEIDFTKYGDAGQLRCIGAVVENIGDELYNGQMNVDYSVRRLPSSRLICIDTLEGYGQMSPGNQFFSILRDTYSLPKFGFLSVTCEVNPEHLVEESNYDNNKASQNFLVLFGIWMRLD